MIVTYTHCGDNLDAVVIIDTTTTATTCFRGVERMKLRTAMSVSLACLLASSVSLYLMWQHCCICVDANSLTIRVASLNVYTSCEPCVVIESNSLSFGRA